MINKFGYVILSFFLLFHLVACDEEKPEKANLLLSFGQLYKTDPMRALAKAAGEGDLDRIKQILDDGADINAQGMNGMPVLFWPLRDKNIKGFSYLLRKGADPNVQWSTGSSVMELVAGLDDISYLRIVLASKGNPNLVNFNSGKTPLFQAVKFGVDDSVILLLQHGANINAKNSTGRTPIFDAISVGDYEIALLLAKNGADLESRDTWGKTLYDIIQKRLDHPSPKSPNYRLDHPSPKSPNYRSFEELLSLIKPK